MDSPHTEGMRYAAALLIAALFGCVKAPGPPAQSALYMDLRKAVEIEEQLGWMVDSTEIDEALPSTLPSVCQTNELTRLGVRRFIEARLQEEGGPARDQYFANGHDLGEVTEALRLERIRALLNTAEASLEECPFWLEQDPGFDGIHATTRRLTLVLESNGGFGLVMQGGEVALGGGGGGRVLLSWGIDEHLSLATGFEAGAAAEFPENEAGDRTLVATLYGGVPLLFRARNGLSVFDIEAAMMLRYRQQEVHNPGLRVSIGYGLSTTRGAGFMPHAVLWVGYEWHPPRDMDPAEHSIRLGTRVGVDWDP